MGKDWGANLACLHACNMKKKKEETQCASYVQRANFKGYCV